VAIAAARGGWGEARGGEPTEEVGEVGVGQAVALEGDRPAGGEEPRRRRGAGEDRGQDAQQVGLLVVDDDTVGGEAAGRGDDVVEGQAAEAMVSVEPAGEAAGHRDRCRTHVERLVGAAEGDDHLGEVGFGGRRAAAARGVDEEVEDDGLAVGQAGEEEPAAAQAREGGLGDRGGEPGRHAGVHGVAASGEHRHRRRRGLGVTGGHRRGHHRQICSPNRRRPARSVMS